MMMSHDDDVHNPPRRGTRSWSTPDPVSRGRRYSHHSRRKNEKDGGFNTKISQSFSPRKRDERDERERERERKRKERRIGTIQSHSLTERAFVSSRVYNRQKELLLLLLLLLTWLGQFTTRKEDDDDKAPKLLLGPRVVIFKVFLRVVIMN